MPTNDPIAPDLLTILATAIEAALLPSWRPKPVFRRIKFQQPEGATGEASLPDKSDPNRMRFFELLFESAGDDAGVSSDEERWTFAGVVLVRVFYPDLAAIPGEGEKALLSSRLQIADYVNLVHKVVVGNVLTHSITGAGSIKNLGANFSAGLTEWRLEVRWEEAIP